MLFYVQVWFYDRQCCVYQIYKGIGLISVVLVNNLLMLEWIVVIVVGVSGGWLYCWCGVMSIIIVCGSILIWCFWCYVFW